jgi:hypothetical protein
MGPSADGSHEHIEGVCTVFGTYCSRAYVAGQINAGEAWYSAAGGASARIRKIDRCPKEGCEASPYLSTEPDHTTANNLENLPRC